MINYKDRTEPKPPEQQYFAAKRYCASRARRFDVGGCPPYRTLTSSNEYYRLSFSNAGLPVPKRLHRHPTEKQSARQRDHLNSTATRWNDRQTTLQLRRRAESWPEQQKLFRQKTVSIGGVTLRHAP